MADNKKICPLVRQACLESRCNLFNPKLETCEISLIAYNLYRLSNALEKKKPSKNGAPPVFKRETDQELLDDLKLL
ncbi:MAG: hypothetical protein C4576_03315 [Desulfobacteraceae bacterium]|nr:MAG: hypothetical protein C4576_03315 [Desulfobacteraceae bacterium]